MPEEDSQRAERSTGDNIRAPRPIGTADVFRAIIEDELRNGRLTPVRRRRIVRYAAAMGLSATEAGDLIAACRRNALERATVDTPRRALRLVHPNPPMIPAGIKLALVAIAAIALDLLLMAVVFS